jgi:molybdate transport system substrate-binding protein
MRLIAASLTSIVVLSGLLAWNSQSALSPDVRPIIVYCAVALQPPVEELAHKFTLETGIPVQVEYGASQVLLTRLELRRDGDLFIPADDDYLRTTAEKKLLETRVPLTRLRPVIAVAAGNPRAVKTLDDLVRPDIRLTLPDPKTAAIGRVVSARLGSRWDRLREHCQILRTTVGDVATDIELGAADATFVWDETAHQVAGLLAIDVPELAGAEAKIAAGILGTSKQPDVAREFARFLAASDRGEQVFKARGYTTLGGEPWSRPGAR